MYAEILVECSGKPCHALRLARVALAPWLQNLHHNDHPKLHAQNKAMVFEARSKFQFGTDILHTVFVPGVLTGEVFFPTDLSLPLPHPPSLYQELLPYFGLHLQIFSSFHTNVAAKNINCPCIPGNAHKNERKKTPPTKTHTNHIYQLVQIIQSLGKCWCKDLHLWFNRK